MLRTIKKTIKRYSIEGERIWLFENKIPFCQVDEDAGALGSGLPQLGAKEEQELPAGPPRSAGLEMCQLVQGKGEQPQTWPADVGWGVQTCLTLSCDSECRVTDGGISTSFGGQTSLQINIRRKCRSKQ